MGPQLVKILFAIKSCHKYAHRRDAQRATWAASIPAEIDLRFFLGESTRLQAQSAADEVILECRDDYQHMPRKLQGICRWARDGRYDAALIGDDDAYIRPERFLASDFSEWHYTGRVRPSLNSRWKFPFCSGIGYCLSSDAIAILASAQWNGDHCDDRWAGQVLASACIEAHPDHRYGVSASRRNMVSLSEGPRAGNDLICVGEFKDMDSMQKVHREFLNQPSEPGRLELALARFQKKYGFQPHHQSDQWRGTRARLQTA